MVARQQRPPQVGGDQDRPASQAVDPGAGDEAEEEPRQQLGDAEDAHRGG